MSGHIDPRQNQILAALPETQFDRIKRHLEPIPLPFGWVIYDTGNRINYLYFPTAGIVSMLQVLTDGASGEIAVVGHEGVVGISLCLGSKSTSNRAIVQSAGYACRLPAGVLDEEFGRGGPLRNSLLRYTQSLFAQMAQMAVCNRHHSLEQQLCRWLLLRLDRLPTNELHVTQELIANMLGVRRVGVTEAAAKLQNEGLIRYVRGNITVLDRPRLEARACECYEAVERETRRLFR